MRAEAYELTPACQPRADIPTCRRCSNPAVGVVAVAELDEGRGGDFISEVPLCGEHLVDVAEACGFGPAKTRTGVER